MTLIPSTMLSEFIYVIRRLKSNCLHFVFVESQEGGGCSGDLSRWAWGVLRSVKQAETSLRFCSTSSSLCPGPVSTLILGHAAAADGRAHPAAAIVSSILQEHHVHQLWRWFVIWTASASTGQNPNDFFLMGFFFFPLASAANISPSVLAQQLRILEREATH